ncbi:MAG TPA: hypothetical protein EYP04_01940 [Anaerolineae bacterium]|nr:hypothetical protein [Anaerolineae bacterium]HIQ06350.1 hypothetical protein [Anaerolineae bacterium]
MNSLFRGNRAGDGTGVNGEGGGLFVSGIGVSGPVTITDNFFESNRGGATGRGGGLALREPYSGTLVSSNIFSDNLAGVSGMGGGLYQDGNGFAVYRVNKLMGNACRIPFSGGGGGGVALSETRARFEDVLVQDNSCTVGGGFHISGSTSVVTLTKSAILSNTADLFGGGIYVRNGQLTVREASVKTNRGALYGLTLRGGGGFFARDADVHIDHSVFQRNVGVNDFSGREPAVGGGLAFLGGQAHLDANLILTNTAWISSAGEIGWGGGLFISGTQASLTNNVIAGNKAEIGDGIYTQDSEMHALHTTIADHAGQGVFVGPDATARLTNTIVSSNGLGITTTLPAGTTLPDHTLFWNNGEDGVTGTDPIWGDPMFLDPAKWDYHLGYSSAAVDAGAVVSVTDDMDGQVRPIGLGYDIGADELCWDVTDDGQVSASDIEEVSLHWNQPTEDNWRYDLDGDGNIDVVDIQLMASHWLEACNR